MSTFTLSATHVRHLTLVLGEKDAQRLAPLLGQVINYPVIDARIRQEEGRTRTRRDKHIAAAKKLESAATSLAQLLRASSSLLCEASAQGYLPPAYSARLIRQVSLAATSNPTQFIEVLAVLKSTNHNLCDSLEDLATHARQWSQAVRQLGSRPPGRNVDNRRLLGEWVALCLRSIGVPLTKSPDGKFARVLEIVYDAAGVHIPADRHREVKTILADPDFQALLNGPG